MPYVEVKTALPDFSTPTMTDKFNPPVSSYPSPLTGYENAEPIGRDALRRHSNNQVEMRNPPNDKPSEAYNQFPDPIEPENGGL